MNTSYDAIIVGGGLVGSALACGIAARGVRTAVLDGSDRDYRASRGNFGLIWVQGKGADFPAYARWSGLAARAWSEFERGLRDATGIDLGLEQTGGYDFCLDQREWDARSEEMRLVQQHTGGAFDYAMLDNAALRERIPQVSADVIGASYSPQDGHVNPLYLLRALQQRMQNLGTAYLPGRRVSQIVADGDGFVVDTSSGRFTAEKVVVCAGLDGERLAAQVGIEMPLHPLRGQLLITERVAPFLPCACLQVRQTREGTLQIGDSHERAGYDDSTTLDVITRIAARALKIFPHLAGVRLQRAWGALRVMTPDGAPVYQQSRLYPGVYAISCHSGVTLAALHAGPLADWICGEPGDDQQRQLISAFSSDRFDVSANRRHSA